ncbi:hypothetical protein F5Y17DRAFT_357058 [Xylariaceae sp. FL0594]|nr:hypothetical protein F5Y17DRAFT_357058 [Xylariaceae sp. FL0594]
MAASSDPRTRIMAHMNREHAAELRAYLRAFNGLSASAAADAELTDLSLSHLTIRSRSGVHTVRVTPEMENLSEARTRLVDMAERAREKLGISDIRITRFAGPRGAGLVSFVGVAFYVFSAAALKLGLLRPGTAAWALLDGYFPYKGAEGFAWLTNAIVVPTLLVHAGEAFWMARSRLARHGVETGSALWWKWVLETFVEGFPTMQRFDGLVKEERVKKDGAKH